LLADSEDPQVVARFWAKEHFAAHHFEASRVRLQPLWMRTARTRCTGATWGPSTRITKRTWIWFRYLRFSICTTRSGPAAHLAAAVSAGKNLYSPIQSAWAVALDSIVGGGVHCLRRAAWQRLRGGATIVRVNSYSEVSDSIHVQPRERGDATRAIRRAIIDRQRDATGTHGDRIMTREADRRRFHVTRFRDRGGGWRQEIADRRAGSGLTSVVLRSATPR